MYSDRIQTVNFAAHTSEEIRSLSVKKITNPETYDQLLHPNYYGLYDPALGPSDKDDRCDTCGMNEMKCPGHFGYIELPLPVYHPMFFKLMLQLLRGSCFKCHRLIPKMSRSQLFVRQCELLDKGLLTEASDLRELYCAYNAEAIENSATDMNLQKVICDKIDAYYHNIVNNCSNTISNESTKNLIKCKQEIVKDFIKIQLLSKIKECPHCKSLLRDVRSEYNTRIYFKSVSHKAVQKAVTSKMIDKLQKTKKTKKEPSALETDGISFKQESATSDILDGNEQEFLEEEEDDNDESEEALKKKLSDQEYVTPSEVKKHMIQLWNVDGKVLKCLLGSYNSPQRTKKVTTPEMFFLDVVCVPPSRFRPQSFMGEKRFENPQTSNLTKVLWHCRLIIELLQRINEPEDGEGYVPVVLATSEGFQKRGKAISVPGKTHKDQLQNAWAELQSDVNTVMDSTLNKLTREPLPGVRQLLEKKEGLFRKHMMGKRVNYACRSVISPDPFINTDEIGVPLVFASKLTYVQPVTTWNLAQLTQMVINGPNKHPGAVMIEYEDGRKTMLSDNEDERRAVAKQLLSSSVVRSSLNGDRLFQGKKVHRHLINGDVLLLNRQPTLHRPSIMAHKAKVLPKERTLRLHYANCKSYNADFDGDEMNAHFPQSELGRSEAYNLVSTNYNYLSPKDGKPLAGLIQDHVVSGVQMTSRDTLFNREDFHQLIYNALIDIPGRVKMVPPCIQKPIPLWSGKQIFSSVLLNVIPDGKCPLNMNGSKAKISDQNWPKGKGRKQDNMYHTAHVNDPYLIESQVIIRDGELMTGVLDKTQYGSTPFGLVHCVYELYGGEVSGKLLSALARLFTAYLQHTGFTLGIKDILVIPNAEEKRVKIIKSGRLCGDESALEALNIMHCDREMLTDRLYEAQHTNQGFELKQLDLAMKSRTDAINNKINNVCIKGLLKKFPENALQLMVQSGAKGSSVNCMQISCLLGQIELEGRRPPLSMSGRSLPSFMRYDTSPRAGGFVDGRFLTGIRPQEYFFHCMAGREGLVDTAVKTSRSGYLQRCLIKHLEALYVQYDMTVRDGDGSVVQFLYGDDGVDVLKHQFLHPQQYKTIVQNYQAYVSLLKPTEVSRSVNVKKAPKLQRKCDRWKRRYGETFSSYYNHSRSAPYNLYESDNKKSMEKKYSSAKNIYGRTQAELKLMSKWSGVTGPVKESYLSQCQPCSDPVLSKYNPTCYFGSVSEKFYNDVNKYIKEDSDDLLAEDEDKDSTKVSKNTFSPLMSIKYMRSLVEPGEAVGLLAGQSIGEPSTQMTLNTFHFAGRGDMNVTLGIPRLREILMTASDNIKTPQMDVIVRDGQEEKAKIIAKQLNKLTLSEVLQHVSVYESLQRSNLDNVTRCRNFRVRLEFLPHYSYEENHDVTPADVMSYVETVFVKRIATAVSKIIRTKEKQRLIDSRADNTPVSTQGSNDEDTANPEVVPDEPDDLADLSDDDIGDGDAADMKGRSRQMQLTSYDDPDAQQEEMQEEADDSILNVRIKGEPEVYDEKIYAEMNEDNVADVKPKQEKLTQDPRVANVLKRDRHIIGYLVDEQNQWCEVTLQFPLAGSKVMLVAVIERLAEKSVVSEAPGISRSMTCKNKDINRSGGLRLKTEGVNISELWKYPDVLDLNSLYSNNIHVVARKYGIEAARRVIIKEVEDVFKVYGIQIDPRHLSLVGDYMTFEGVYKPFNRIGIESNPFPFQKMSFETSMHFLRSATAFGQSDGLGSPSSRIIVGRVIGTGTGMMDLLPQISL